MGVTLAAPDVPALELVSTLRSSKTWDRIERLRDNAPGFPHYDYLPTQRQGFSEIVDAFDSAQPPSNEFLLHCAPGWQQKDRDEVPVLLLHGMTQDAQCWYDCYGLGVSISRGHRNDGLAPYLEHKNKKVFAVTFPHANGDQKAAGRIVGDAVARVRQLTGATEVDVVGHSMGGIGGRVYATNAVPEFSPYRHDVRKFLTLGTPHLGTDLPFRMGAALGLLTPVVPLVGPLMRLMNINQDVNLGGPWDGIRVFPGWMNIKKYSVHGGHFPGLSQLLYRWDDKYPVQPLLVDSHSTYYGGKGLIGRSPGIEPAIAQGGHFIEQLRAHPLDPDIELSTLAGDAPVRNLPFSGKSDSLVYLDSALATDDMLAGGAKLGSKEILPLDHVQLIHDIRAKRWVLDTLNHRGCSNTL